MTTTTEKQTSPIELKSACSACGNTRTHTRVAWSKGLAAWLYECPTCGNLATQPQLAAASKSIGLIIAAQ